MFVLVIRRTEVLEAHRDAQVADHWAGFDHHRSCPLSGTMVAETQIALAESRHE